MQLGRRGRRLRIAVPLILLIMVLMRLVWMQLRAYPAVPEARALVSLDVVHRGAEAGCPHAVTRAGPVEDGSRRALLQAAYEWVASPGYVLLGSFGCQGDLLEAPRAVR